MTTVNGTLNTAGGTPVSYSGVWFYLVDTNDIEVTQPIKVDNCE